MENDTPLPGSFGDPATLGSNRDWANAENDPYLQKLVQDRLNSEFGSDAAFNQDLASQAASAGGGVSTSRIADLYNAAKKSVHDQAAGGREGVNAAFEQYKKDSAATNAQVAGGIATTPPPVPPGAGTPAEAAAVASSDAAMKSLADQRAKSYNEAASYGKFGATVNINTEESKQVNALDAESASKMAEATAANAKVNSGVASAKNDRAAAKRTREREIWDSIKQNHGVDPVTGETGNVSTDLSKLNPKESFDYMTSAYTDYMRKNGANPTADWRNSRAGRTFADIEKYASGGKNDTERYARARKALTDFQNGIDPYTDKPLGNDANETKVDLFGKSGKSPLNFDVLADWLTAAWGGSNPLSANGGSSPNAPRKKANTTSTKAPNIKYQAASGASTGHIS